MPEPSPSPAGVPGAVGLCPFEGCQAEFFMPDPKPGDRCPMDHEGEAPELVIYSRSSQPAGGEGLVDAVSDLLAATEPYVEDAAPGETLFGPWAHRFDHLQRARHNAVKAVAALSPPEAP
jgi:hypothetical protein